MTVPFLIVHRDPISKSSIIMGQIVSFSKSVYLRVFLFCFVSCFFNIIFIKKCSHCVTINDSRQEFGVYFDFRSNLLHSLSYRYSRGSYDSISSSAQLCVKQQIRLGSLSVVCILSKRKASLPSKFNHLKLV